MENFHPAVNTAERKPFPNNRRCRPRHRIHSPGYASLGDDARRGALDLNEIVNISEDGLALQAEPPLKTNDSVKLSLDLPEMPKIPAAGRVIWSDARGRAGIRFEQIGEEHLLQLKQWLMANALFAYASHESADQASTDPITDHGGRTEETRSQPSEPAQAPVQLQGARQAATDVILDLQERLQGLADNRENALQLIADRARELTASTGAAIAVRPDQASSSSDDIMLCRASSGSSAPGAGSELRVGSGFSGACVRAARLMHCDDTETDPLVDRESCRSLGIRAIVAVPVMVEGEVVGLLEVFSANRSHFQAGDYDLLQRLTPLIAASLQRPEPAKPVLDGWAVHERGILFSPESGPAPEKSDGKSEPGIPVPRSHLVLLTAAAALIALVLGYVLAPWIQDKFQTRVAPRQDASNSTRISSPPPIPNTLEELRKAAEQGDTNAQFALGSRYATGEDVPQDYAQAAQWFNSAAEKGHVVAQATLAAYYWSGLGVPKDITKAYFWSILARAGGDEGSKFRAAALTSHMTRPQVLAAQQQADEWLRKHQLGPAPGSNP